MTNKDMRLTFSLVLYLFPMSIQSRNWVACFILIIAVQCPQPNSVRNAILTGSTFRYMEKVTYTCHEGFNMAEGGTSATLMCTSSGIWSRRFPTCRRRCTRHLLPRNPDFL